jgi:Helix-turn-helix domain
MTPDSKKTQQGKILNLLLHAKGRWVSLPEILGLGIAQYGARIFELRRLGFRIRNRTERVEGQIRSWFCLERQPQQQPLPIEMPTWEHRDDG